MTRTDAFALPLLMDEPIGWGFGEIGTDDAERFARDKARLSEQPCALGSRQNACRSRRRDLRAPKDFVRHPVPDSSETALQQQDRLDRRPGVAIEERIHEPAIELLGRDVGSSCAPPIRLGFALMKPHSPKETRIAQDQRLLPLLQDEMIVFLWAEPRWLGAQFAGHPEMDPNPIPTGKLEQHLLPSRKGTQETTAAQTVHDLPRVASAKNPFPRMELHREDFLAQAAVPLLSKKLHLGQFRHRAK